MIIVLRVCTNTGSAFVQIEHTHDIQVHTRASMAKGCNMILLNMAEAVGSKLEKNNKVRHIIMTQMASLLAVATVFFGLWTLNIYITVREAGLIRETKLPIICACAKGSPKRYKC
jgi:hypothetical protein